MHLRSRHHRNRLIEQFDQQSQHPCFSLAPQSEKEHVVSGEHRVLDLGNHRLVVAQNSGKQRAAVGQPCEQVGSHLVFDTSGLVTTGSEFTKIARAIGHCVARENGGRCGEIIWPSLATAGESRNQTVGEDLGSGLTVIV